MPFVAATASAFTSREPWWLAVRHAGCVSISASSPRLYQRECAVKLSESCVSREGRLWNGPAPASPTRHQLAAAAA
jgi:hypothetical protein